MRGAPQVIALHHGYDMMVRQRESERIFTYNMPCVRSQAMITSRASLDKLPRSTLAGGRGKCGLHTSTCGVGRGRATNRAPQCCVGTTESTLYGRQLCACSRASAPAMASRVCLGFRPQPCPPGMPLHPQGFMQPLSKTWARQPILRMWLPM